MYINNHMATYNNTNDNLVEVSPNIMISIDDNNMGEMYVYDNKYSYILNGLTASDLVYYFNDDEENFHLAEEIQDTMMEITINKGTH